MRIAKSPAFWCFAIAALFGLAQLLLLDTSRFLTWDEAVYVSEVSPFAQAVGMGAHRARGITLIVAPVTLLTESMTILRGYLAVVSSAALFGAFFVWCRSIRWAAPIAMGLFASSWMAVFYGSAVYPNYYTAVIAVGALGVTVAMAGAPSPGKLIAVGVLVAFAALTRPLDGLILGVCVGMAGVALVRTHRWPIVATVTSGLVLGALPWAFEAWARFGGPLARLETSSDTIGGGLRNNIPDYLRVLDGTGTLNPAAVLWLILLLVAGLLALVGPDVLGRRVGAIALVSAFLFAAPYVFATEPVLERFMLPGLALLSIAAGVGLVAVTSRLSVRPVWAVVVGGVVLLAAVSWNVPALAEWNDRQTGNARTALLLGQAVAEEVSGGDCFVLSPAYHPSVAFAAGCADSWSLADSFEANLRRLDSARDAGLELFVVTLSDSPGDVVGEGWRCRPIEALAERGWQLCSPGAP